MTTRRNLNRLDGARSAPLDVRVTSFTSAPADEVRDGLLGWVGLLVNGRLQLDGVALRRTRAGRLRLSFPIRRDRAGREHPVVHPVHAAARSEIERAVFAALSGEVAP